MSDTAPTTTTEPPATIPIGQASDLATFREARSKGLTEIPNPAAKPAEKVDEPADVDPEVAADPDLQQAIDELEPPPAEETPAQKAARTKRHKEAGKKSASTRYRNQRDTARTALSTAEAELADWRSGKRTYQAPTPSTAAPTTKTETATDDPKPSLKDFPLEKFSTEDDPYAAQQAALAEAVARWGARDEHRKQEATARETRQREQADQQQRDARVAYDKRADDARARVADFDAVAGSYSLPPDHPVSPHLYARVMESEVGPDIAYHLGKTPDDLARLMASPTLRALDIAFGEVQATVKAALKAKKDPPQAPPKITPAQEPIPPVNASAGTGVVSRDPKDIHSVDEWRAQKARSA